LSGDDGVSLARLDTLIRADEGEDPAMSDEQERRRDPRADETRQYQPFDDDEDGTRVDGIHPEDGPRSGDTPAPDRTRQMPPTPGEDATVVTPRGAERDSTSVMPPARDWEAQEAAWAGRATVRPPRSAEYGTTAADWDALPPPEEEPRGKWWMPIVIGIVALLLLGLLGWGIYLIVQNSDEGAGTPAPAPSVTAPATEPATTPPTTRPTTEPTTTPPTTEPTETAITVPALVGLSQQEAQQALDRRGLNYRLIFRTSDNAPAGTVIDSDPAEGQEVPPDTQVTLVIATAATTDPGVPPTTD
jgi:PASTA domain